MDKRNSITTPYFTINLADKTFEMTKKTFAELANPNSEVSKAVKNYKSMGYNFTPVCRQRDPQKRSTAAQRLKIETIEKWIEDNFPNYMPIWEMSGEVKDADGKKFSAMVRRAVFLYENVEARKDFGVGDYYETDEEAKKRQNREGDNKYKPTEKMKTLIRLRNKALKKKGIKVADNIQKEATEESEEE